jgi:hypothetical protein
MRHVKKEREGINEKKKTTDKKTEERKIEKERKRKAETMKGTK